MIVRNIGLTDYMEAWQLQKQVFAAVIDSASEDTLIICEHPHVYTLGRNGDPGNMLASEDFLKSAGAAFYRVDRGGDITYHGPGQMVAYPILNIEHYGLSLKGYVNLLEQSVIETLSTWNINGVRKPGATGVWLDDSYGQRKICAIGVKASHFVTMHGLALNINTDLKYFSYINPCGFTDKPVTSMKKETRGAVDASKVREVFCDRFLRLLGVKRQ